jgi:alanyl-tRNA synthetase
LNAQVVATINDARRTEIRRHHTATHMLHWALREVLGEHVKQAGSLVEPERLRFDFSHYAAVSPEELREIERLANLQVLKNCGVAVYETSKDEATKAGAIAFFGDKYGDLVRVLDAGDSVELCGGTHVGATGDIGAIKILSESSIGSNLRRIEAVAGTHSLTFIQQQNVTLSHAAELLGATPDTVNAYIERKLDDMRALQDENRMLRSRLAATQAGEIAATAVNGGVVQQIDGLTPGDLRELALAIRNVSGIRAVVLAGITDTGGVAIVAATTPSISVSAGSLIAAAAKAVGGGGGGKGDIATAGGKNPEALDEALSIAREKAAAVIGSLG